MKVAGIAHIPQLKVTLVRLSRIVRVACPKRVIPAADPFLREFHVLPGNENHRPIHKTACLCLLGCLRSAYLCLGRHAAKARFHGAKMQIRGLYTEPVMALEAAMEAAAETETRACGQADKSAGKTFYLETFGCQMNMHDSEKVAGTLEHLGYRQVETVEEANLVLWNTCSIREKAEQKVFNRLNDYKKFYAAGKRFGVLGCVAQQEGEKIFERAPYVSLVSGSASYSKLPEMLERLERGESHITGLDDRQTDRTFETEFTSRTNPHRGYITIIEGCDKFCSYCVVPYTRGRERSRSSESVIAEAQRMADGGWTEIQLLGQNVNSYLDPLGKRSFAELLLAVAAVPGIRRVRFTTSHPRDFTRDIVDAIDSEPRLCDHVHLPVQSGSDRVLSAMQRGYTRDEYIERISWIRSAGRPISITTDMIVGFPGEQPEDFEQTLSLMNEVGYDAIFAFKYSPRPNTPALVMEDSIDDEEKSSRLQALLNQQREIQKPIYSSYIGKEVEVMVEGYNKARGQVIGRSSQNKTVNFVPAQPALPSAGSYLPVRITNSFPNSLVGQAIA